VAECVRRLINILTDERNRGYDDEVVIGGLASYIENWSRQARAEGLDSGLIQEIVSYLLGYHGKPQSARAEAVGASLSRLRQLAPTRMQAQAVPPAAAPEPGPAVQPSAAAEPGTGPQPAQGGEARLEAPAPRRAPHISLDAPVTAVRGIKEARARLLARLGIVSVRDLLHYYPREYHDRSTLKTINQIAPGEQVTIAANVFSVSTRQPRPGMRVTTAVLMDGTGRVEATWFNQPWVETRLAHYREILVTGKVDLHLGRLTISRPEWEPLTSESLNDRGLTPIYGLTEGINQRWLRKEIANAVESFGDLLEDELQPQLRQELGLIPMQQAIATIHHPPDWDGLDQARKRLAFTEFLMLQLGMLQRKRAARQAEAAPLMVDEKWRSEFESALPFALTAAQSRALDEILGDLAAPHPMLRLLQGDVGSGKTVVALAAMLAAVSSGKQAAFMAPTEILAEQHYRTFQRLLEGKEGRPFSGARVLLLTGSLPAPEKAQAQAAIAAGDANIIVGTHALIQEAVAFRDLGVVVVDEQHRFGVEQRAVLSAKGRQPHVLVMSATPIPRTLALTLYGDLDLSLIDELPAGRMPVITVLRGEAARESIYAFMRDQVRRGYQGFVICPAITGSEDGDVRAAVDEFQRLQESIFPDLHLGLLHGKLTGQQKDETMRQFATGAIDILVATSVVEVGIDVPNATFIVVEQAERFGLAQLHQFRGRVGRGSARSYCVLMTDQVENAVLKQLETGAVDCSSLPTGVQRLDAVRREADGFRLAEIDLRLRGPGEFFGKRQSGLPDLRMAELSDLRTLELARRLSERILDADPVLENPENRALQQALARFWQNGALAV